MLWVIVLFAFLFLCLAALRMQPSVASKNAAGGKAHVSRRKGKSCVRLRFSKKHLRNLKKSLKKLSGYDGNSLPPASKLLCKNIRMLRAAFQQTSGCCRSLPRLPRSDENKAYAMLFAEKYLQKTAYSLSKDSLLSEVASWQETRAFTNDEITALPALLLVVLCIYISDYIKQNINVQLPRHLEKFEENDEWLSSIPEGKANNKPLQTGETDTTQDCVDSVRNAITSLETMNLFPWTSIFEQISILNKMMLQDGIYKQMDAESREAYRFRVAHLAKSFHLPERIICSSAISLAKNADTSTAASHIGYYLLDDGLPSLIKDLNTMTFLRKAAVYIKRHFAVVNTLFSWVCFVSLLAAGFFNGYAVVVLVPFVLVFLTLFHRLFFSAHRAFSNSTFTPRILVQQLSDDDRILVICQAVLSDTESAKELVRRMHVMHEANPDPNIHFLLLGDFPDSLTATGHTDADIINTVASAVISLADQTKHPFYYIQRGRAYVPGSKTHHSTERKHGGLISILRLIEGYAPNEQFAFSSFDPSSLQHRYHYVITVDEHTDVTPDSILRLVGAMKHPLQKRHMLNGRMHGAALIHPTTQMSKHPKQTILSRCLVSAAEKNFDMFCGYGIIEPKTFLMSIQNNIPCKRLLDFHTVEGLVAGSTVDKHTCFLYTPPQTLQDSMSLLHYHTRSTWQLLPCILPFTGSKVLDQCGRMHLWRSLIQTLSAPAQLLIILYAALTNRPWLLAATILLPDIDLLFPFSLKNLTRSLLQFAMLPCRAYEQSSAALSALFRLLFAKYHLQDWLVSSQQQALPFQPSMTYFVLNMTCAGVLAACTLLFQNEIFMLCPAVIWAGLPFLLPYLEQTKEKSLILPEQIQQTLVHLAQKTFTCIETAAETVSSPLPPANIQLEPRPKIAGYISSESIGMYLCSLLAAEKMRILSLKGMAKKMDEAVQALEALPKWNGLLYERYELPTLQPTHESDISSSSSGYLAVCLMTCAQGLRALMPNLDPYFYHLPDKLDALCSDMQLHRLYDSDANLFYTHVDPTGEKTSYSHYSLLSSNGTLLSYAALTLHQVPVNHWLKLSREKAASDALLSENGAISEYMFPMIFLPLEDGSVLDRSCRKVCQLQRKKRFGNIYGTGECFFFSLDASEHYENGHFGIIELALHKPSLDLVVAPYASMLCLPIEPRFVYDNFIRMQALGLDSALGLFDAADFSFNRTGKKGGAVIRAYSSIHQGMILCSICNALCDGYLSRLFMDIPSVHAYRFLLQE